MITEHTLENLLHTLQICRQELPENSDAVHFERLRSIETLLKGLLTPPAPALARARHESAREGNTDSPISTWGDFKTYAESAGMKDDDRLAWIDVDTSNPNTVIVYDLVAHEKVIEQMDEVIEASTVI